MRALTQFGTSHSQIVQHFGLDRNECIGYALKKRTGGHELSCQSQTLNLRKFGDVTQSTDNAYLPQPWIDCVRLSLERLLPDMEGNVTAQGDAFAAEDFLDPEWLR